MSNLRALTRFACVLALSSVCAPSDAWALRVVQQVRISDPGEPCATSPDVTWFNGQFDVVYSGAIVDCNVASTRALRLFRVDPSSGARLVGRISPVITGPQLVTRLSVATQPEPVLVVGSMALSPRTAVGMNVFFVTGAGASRSHAGMMTAPPNELVGASMDCLGGRCDFVSVEQSMGTSTRRVRIATSPSSLDTAAVPRAMAVTRGSVVEAPAGPWESFASGTTNLPIVNPAGSISVLALSSNSTGAVAVRGVGGVPRVFAAVDAGGFERVLHMLPPFDAASVTLAFNGSERLDLHDGDGYVSTNSFALAMYAPGSSALKALIFKDNTRTALTSLPANIAISTGWTVRSARIAAASGAMEGRALIVYEMANAMAQSQVWAALATCSNDVECDDADPVTTDQCAPAADGVQRCQHASLSISDAMVLPFDGSAEIEDVAVIPVDSAVWIDGSAEGGASIDATVAIDSGLGLDGVGGDGRSDPLDATALDSRAPDVGPIANNDLRFTGGSCDCRAAVAASGHRPRLLAFVLAAAAIAAVERRRRR